MVVKDAIAARLTVSPPALVAAAAGTPSTVAGV
jgi:hypothetical protein